MRFVRAASLVAATVLTTAAAAQAAAPPGFYESRVLEPAASFVAGKPATVWCASSQSAWHVFMVATYGTDDGAHGSSTPGDDVLKMSAETCAPLKTATKRAPRALPLAAVTAEILTHEAIHLRGERDEGVTDCAAMHATPGVLTRYFHVKPGKVLRAAMAALWRWHAQSGDAYRSVC